MKVNPNLFPQPATPLRPINEASEARRAFEAMLSASAARTRDGQVSPINQPSNIATGVRTTARVATKEPELAQPQIARPGRVLDIKV